MTLVELLQQGSTGSVPLLAGALVLGALHGLEPGHSKAMMAGFVIAVRGTPWQVALLGLSAAISHTLIVWMLALLGFSLGDGAIGAQHQAWMLAGSGVLMTAVGTWSASRAWSRLNATTDVDDAHQKAHAAELRTVFKNNKASTAQVITFGISSGLIPCSAAVAVLLVCLQQDRPIVGFGLVTAFTTGLALMLVATGMLAAGGLRTAARIGPATRLVRNAPWLSGVVVAVAGLVMVNDGLRQLGL